MLHPVDMVVASWQNGGPTMGTPATPCPVAYGSRVAHCRPGLRSAGCQHRRTISYRPRRRGKVGRKPAVLSAVHRPTGNMEHARCARLAADTDAPARRHTPVPVPLSAPAEEEEA